MPFRKFVEIPVNSENSTLITLYLVLEEMKVVGIVVVLIEMVLHRDLLEARFKELERGELTWR